MKTAVVILNWNGAKMLREFLPCVVKYSEDESTDVVIADNASTDDSLEYVSKAFPSCRIIRFAENYGFAEGYNKAFEALRGDGYKYFVLLNSDVEVTEGWLHPLVSFMENNLNVAACQPKLLSQKDKKMFEYAGASGGFLDRYGYPFCRGRVFETVEEDNGQYDYATEILWATGAALMIRSKDYWNVGGLDGRFFAHNEEIDLCWRLRISGRKLYCLPESFVYHVGGGTLPKSNPMKTFLNFRNNLTMLYKCLPDDELRHVMRWRWFLDYLAAWETLVVNRNWGDFCAIYRARRAFRRWRRDFSEDRQQIQASRKVDAVAEQKRYSLLWQYYAKGHKHFSDLPA
jgi:GT2 family glycosyltransferase